MRRLIRQTVAGAFILYLGISGGGFVEAEEVLNLSLEDAIEMAMNQNLGIQAARLALMSGSRRSETWGTRKPRGYGSFEPGPSVESARNGRSVLRI